MDLGMPRRFRYPKREKHFVTFFGGLFRAVHFAIFIVRFGKILSCNIQSAIDGRTRLTLFVDHLNHLVGGT